MVDCIYYRNRQCTLSPCGASKQIKRIRCCRECKVSKCYKACVSQRTRKTYRKVKVLQGQIADAIGNIQIDLTKSPDPVELEWTDHTGTQYRQVGDTLYVKPVIPADSITIDFKLEEGEVCSKV